jgi:predicted O-methyltransferase YrrM
MSFTQNWFEGLALKNFEDLKNIIDINKPINFLEIGCYEGNCHMWMYKNILLNSDSKSTVIDPFEESKTHPDAYNKFTTNLNNYLDKIRICKGFSDNILPNLEKESFDIIYIDGDHSALAAYNDAINSFPLLKKGGIMIFDDYLWIGTIDGKIGDITNPCKGVNNFLKEYNDKVKIMDGFNPKCDIIDIDKLYSDDKYRENYRAKFNYQMFCTKL